MPCEILVKAETYTHPDPKIDAAGVYKVGDLVLGKDLPFEWGSDEGPPKFAIWTIPDMSLAQFETWCVDRYGCKPFDSEYEATPVAREEGQPVPPPSPILRRRVYVDKDELPPLGASLFSTGKAELPPDITYIKLKPTPVFE